MGQDKPEKAKSSLKLKPLFSLLQHSNALGLLLSSLVCPLHAGIASVMNVDLQTAPSALFSPVVAVRNWDIKLTGDRKQNPVLPLQPYVQNRQSQAGGILFPAAARKPPDTMTLHNPKEGSPAPAFMDRLVFVQKINQSLQIFLYWRSPALITTVSGMSGAGGGDDDDGNDHSRRKKFELEPQAEWFAWAPDSLIQRCLKQKKRLLKILHQKMQWAQACGNRELARILRDRIMLIEIDRDFLQQQTSYSAPLFQTQMQEWLLRDSQEIQHYDQQHYDQQHYDQVVNGGDCQTPGYFFWGTRARQSGSGGSDTLGSGSASKSSVQTGIGSRQNGADFHHPSAVLSSRILSSHILSSHKGHERGDEPPPAKKARLEPADSIFCSLCQNTLNEQEVTRVLRGSTAEPVVCDVCLHSASQALPHEITGKRKVTRKIIQPDQAAPGSKRGKSQPRKRKQNSNRKEDAVAKRARLEPRGMGAQSTTGIVEELEALQQHLAFEMSAQEIEVTKQLFEHLKNKKIKVKATFHKLLGKVDRKKLPKFCNKVTVFFGSVTTITDTGCLTCMLRYTKRHIQNFAEREDSELKYLAGLDTLRSFSSMNNNKGLPKQSDVQKVLSWPEWKDEDGQFSMELFRAFSSMNNGKGLLEQDDVKRVLDWPEWKVEDDQFSMELFRAFSSMNKSRGLPEQDDVKKVLGWPEWRKDGRFSIELFRAFSSMNHGKGLPEQHNVKKVLDWPVWRENAQFRMELLRAFSSMNNGKGLPNQDDVKKVLGWPEWKDEDGQFSMELFRAFSSMNNGKGLPSQVNVKKVLGWPEWKEDGQFSMELLRAFSSINNGKGLPKQDDVRKALDGPEWKGEDGQFSIELFRAFSSMNHGKGLPNQNDVKKVLGWPEWKDEDRQFSMKLFRAFSSMYGSRGLPQQHDVKEVLDWPEWKDEDGQFSIELFRAFSSMCGLRGLPKQGDVKRVLGWPEWKDEDGQFSMELFRAFSSIHHGKGLPKQDDVREVLDWPEWKKDGQFSMERFRVFSSMNNGKGLPKQNDVKKVLGWLTGEGQFNASLLKLMSRLYASEGIPDIKNLRQYEQKLSELFFANTVTDLESDDEDEQSCLIRQTALFLSTRKRLYSLNFKNVEQFHQQVAGDADRRLEKLLTLLISYGGAGVTCYLALNDNNRKALLSTCTSRIPLPLVMKAINDFSPPQRKQYLFFSKNLKPPPEKEQWNDILLQLHRLASVLKTLHIQRLYLEVVWSLAPSDRDVFLDETKAASVKKVFPSLNALKKLAKKHSRQWLKELLEACLQYGQGTLSGDSIKRLFAALLETQHPMFGHGDIPDHFLSGYIELGDSAIFIPITPPTQTTDELALHFVASVMEVLSDMFYDYKANTLKIEQYGGEIHTFPAPELKIHHKGLVISNWTGEVFNRFLAVTEFPERYYFSKEAWQQHCTPEVPGYFQRRTAACHQRERAAPDTHTFQPLSIPALMGLLKNNINITPAAWKSFDHHKDRLPRAAHSQLLSEIEKASHEDIPVSLRDYLEAKRPPPEKEKLPQSEMAAPTSTPPFTVVETLSEEEQFRRLWADLSRKELLVVADLELLAGYKEYMTMEHIVDLLKRTDAIMEPYRLDELRQFLGEKRDLHSRNDPLLLDLTDEVVSYLIEAEI